MTLIPGYMTPKTELPPYLPFPRFLLGIDLSLTAKIVYTLLLDRTTLSKKMGWSDENGRIFILYPVEKIAEDIDRSPTSVKAALAELAAHGLLERQRLYFSGPNRLYVLLPDGLKKPSDGLEIPSDGQKSDLMTDGNPAVIQPENSPSYSRKSDLMTGGKLSDNQLSNNNLREPNEGVNARASRGGFGRYENVLLTEEEYASLRAECPDTDRLIEKLSAYMRSTGRVYADHAATLRLWYERDKPDKPALPDYTPMEGESL